MKIFIGPSGCDLVLEALRKLLTEYQALRYDNFHYSDITADEILIREMDTKIRNIKSMIGFYEALKNSYTEEGLKEKFLWMAKEE